ncbi:MAG: hypothetical protein L7U83_14765, partial [Akkermansiaceae bacterium]|nr:hypothetical protein [Akkermansiaceae bacterium]
MKIYCTLVLLFCSWLSAQEAIAPPETSSPEKVEVRPETVDHRIVIEAPGPPTEPKLFYVIKTSLNAKFTEEALVESADLTFDVMQGSAKKFSVEVLGKAPVESVAGTNLQSWAMRQEGANRFLDFIPKDPMAESLKVVVTFKRGPIKIPSSYEVSTFGPSEASGFSAVYAMSSVAGLRYQILKAEGLVKLKGDEGVERFAAAGRAMISAGVSLSAAKPAPAELRDIRLEGEVFSNEGTATFRLLGTAHITSKEPISLPVLSGRAAPAEAMVTDEYRLVLSSQGYQIEFQKPGVYPIDLAFVTSVQATGEWRKIDFIVPSEAVVPIELKGITSTAVFDATLPVSPVKTMVVHGAFLPASGSCSFAWQPEIKKSDGKLFFTSEAMGEVSVGAGLLRQVTSLTINTLQGSLPSLQVQLAGAGEVLAVEGEN